MSNACATKSFHVDDNNSASFKSEQKITKRKTANGRKDVTIMMSVKYLSNFGRTLEMPLIICEINFILTCSERCLLSNDIKAIAFVITDTKLYVPILTLSTQDNTKLLQQLKSGLERIIN